MKDGASDTARQNQHIRIPGHASVRCRTDSLERKLYKQDSDREADFDQGCIAGSIRINFQPKGHHA